MKAVDTKTRILDVAQDLIQRLGVNGMSYKDISEVVGIRKASIHTHFPKKDDLLAALLDRYNDRTLRVLDGIIASDESPETKLRRYFGLYEATMCSGQQDKVCLYAMVGAELATLNHPLCDRVRNFYQKNIAQIAVILDEGRQSNDFQFTGDSLDTATLIFSLLEGAMLIARADGGVEKFRSVIEQLMKLLKD